MAVALLQPRPLSEQKLSGSHKALVEMQDIVAELLRTVPREHPATQVRPGRGPHPQAVTPAGVTLPSASLRVCGGFFKKFCLLMYKPHKFFTFKK